MSKKKDEAELPDFKNNMPTNRYAAKRPYCTKHGRAMLDIGGEHPRPVRYEERFCPACRAEKEFLKLTRSV